MRIQDIEGQGSQAIVLLSFLLRLSCMSHGAAWRSNLGMRLIGEYESTSVSET